MNVKGLATKLDNADIKLGRELTLARPLVSWAAYIPTDLHLEEGPNAALWWREFRNSFSDERIGKHETPPIECCLTEFVRLHSASDEQVRDFALKWGVLGLWPLRRECCFLWQKQEIALYNPPIDDQIWLTEPTQLWRTVADHFRTLLVIGADLSQKSEVEQVQWDRVAHFPQGFVWNAQRRRYDDPTLMEPLEAMRKALRSLVSRWTRIAPLRLIMEEEDGSPTVRLDVGEAGEDWTAAAYSRAEQRGFGSDLRDYKAQGKELPTPRQSILLNTLIVQLVAALSGPIHLCSVCGNPYEPTRKPRLDRLNFCDDPICKDKGGNLRSNKSHAKKREQKAEANRAKPGDPI